LALDYPENPRHEHVMEFAKGKEQVYSLTYMV